MNNENEISEKENTGMWMGISGMLIAIVAIVMCVFEIVKQIKGGLYGGNGTKGTQNATGLQCLSW